MLITLWASLFNWNEFITLFYLSLIFFLLFKCKKQHDSRSEVETKWLEQSSRKLMPSPPSLPIIGHIHLLRDYKHNPWDGFEAIRKEFGDIVSLKMGIHPMVLVSSSEAMREILLKKGDIFSDRPNFPRHHIIFGGDRENSLALCNWSTTHRDRRKMCKRGIVPNKFSSRNQLLEDIISRLVVKFTNNISKRDSIHLSGTQEPQYYFKTTKKDILFLTSDIFMEFLCNEQKSHSDPEYEQFVYGCDFVFWDINQSYLIDFLPFLTSLGLGFSYLRTLKRITDFLRNYIDDQIFDPRLKKHTGSGESSEDNVEDYLDSLIMEYLAKVSLMSIADYKVGFADLLAGHAAVANILMRTLGHLALDPKTQDMIYNEAVDADIENVNYKPPLPVTEAAMQEALRVASSPIVPHVAREDTSINDFHVPKGSMVLFNNYHLNLAENLWSDPQEFKPARFLESYQDEPGINKFKLNIPKHFMPFSVGLRQCLGYKMVETTTIVTVANICRRYTIRVNDEDLARKLIAPKGSVALNPDSECFELKLYPR